MNKKQLKYYAGLQVVSAYSDKVGVIVQTDCYGAFPYRVQWSHGGRVTAEHEASLLVRYRHLYREPNAVPVR